MKNWLRWIFYYFETVLHAKKKREFRYVVVVIIWVNFVFFTNNYFLFDFIRLKKGLVWRVINNDDEILESEVYNEKLKKSVDACSWCLAWRFSRLYLFIYWFCCCSEVSFDWMELAVWIVNIIYLFISIRGSFILPYLKRYINAHFFIIFSLSLSFISLKKSLMNYI